VFHYSFIRLRNPGTTTEETLIIGGVSLYYRFSLTIAYVYQYSGVLDSFGQLASRSKSVEACTAVMSSIKNYHEPNSFPV
jgi:hypothetical protein